MATLNTTWPDGGALTITYNPISGVSDITVQSAENPSPTNAREKVVKVGDPNILVLNLTIRQGANQILEFRDGGSAEVVSAGGVVVVPIRTNATTIYYRHPETNAVVSVPTNFTTTPVNIDIPITIGPNPGRMSAIPSNVDARYFAVVDDILYAVGLTSRWKFDGDEWSLWGDGQAYHGVLLEKTPGDRLVWGDATRARVYNPADNTDIDIKAFAGNPDQEMYSAAFWNDLIFLGSGIHGEFGVGTTELSNPGLLSGSLTSPIQWQWESGRFYGHYNVWNVDGTIYAASKEGDNPLVNVDRMYHGLWMRDVNAGTGYYFDGCIASGNFCTVLKFNGAWYAFSNTKANAHTSVDGIWKSLNGLNGHANWSRLNTSSATTSFKKATILMTGPGNTPELYLCGRPGLFKLVNDDMVPVSTEFNDLDVTVFDLHLFKGKLYVGTSGAGVYEMNSDGSDLYHLIGAQSGGYYESFCEYKGRLYIGHHVGVGNDIPLYIIEAAARDLPTTFHYNNLDDSFNITYNIHQK